MKRAPRDKFSPLPVNPPALRATTSNENVVLLICKHLRVYFRGNRPERRSPIRRVGVRPQDRAGSETGAPIARFMAGEQVRREQGTFHEPEDAADAGGARAAKVADAMSLLRS